MMREEHPFPHMVCENFFPEDEARAIAEEFPQFVRERPWHTYSNPLEDKLTCNDWNAFGPATYSAFTRLNSPAFVEELRAWFGLKVPLYIDPGLHGGGLHAHAIGGKLNTHLDYVLHPKLRLQRKLNLLVYLNPRWRDDWGGSLGLWEARENGPGALVKAIEPRFNRAVIFATPNAWHGLPEPIACPAGEVRQSMAVYYLTDPEPDCEQRTRALFAPRPEQQDDAKVLALIQARADESRVAQSYRTSAGGP